MFANAVLKQKVMTENGMPAQAYSGNYAVDLFYQAGGVRGQDIIPLFAKALGADRNLAVRTALWLRDIRGGAGERQLFLDILMYLEKADIIAAARVIDRIPELGRWDDMLVVTNPQLWSIVVDKVRSVLFTKPEDIRRREDALCGKWMPRKGPIAARLTKSLGLTPKQYRQHLVAHTRVVETLMCAGKWSDINYSHVPSVAVSHYRTAFFRRDEERFKQFIEDVTDGKDGVKISAGAIYPYEVLRALNIHNLDSADVRFVTAQWNALPNYVGDASILPMVDVSGSMDAPVSGKTPVTCMDVAVSLGLYLSEKNTGPFKDVFLTFSGNTKFELLTGNIAQKFYQLRRAEWAMNTDIERAFSVVLQTALEGNVAPSDMPKYILILSDMQFDVCIHSDDSAIEMIRRKYSEAGYAIPKIVFWNLRGTDNLPVMADEKGTAMVSGFSPAILEAILSDKLEEFTPEAVALKKLLSPRYDW